MKKRHSANLQGLNPIDQDDWNNSEWQNKKMSFGLVGIVALFFIPLMFVFCMAISGQQW